MVALGNSGMQVIAPLQAPRRSYFNSNAGVYAGRTNVPAIVWGAMQNHPSSVDPSIFTKIAIDGSFTCSDLYFGFNGLPNPSQTGVVFYQYWLTGNFQCAAGRESTTVLLNTWSSDSGDPLSGRGLLRTTPQVNGFYLKQVTGQGEYLAMTVTGLSATASTRAGAALFHYVSPGSSNVPQALQITSG